MPGPVRSTRRFRFTSALAALPLAFLPVLAAAQDLLTVYREAVAYDATYAAAKRSAEAGREKGSQGLALLLPTLNLSAGASRIRSELDSHQPLLLPSFTRYPESASYTLTFTQPLFRRQNWLQYEQGGVQVKQAEMTFSQAQQDLILRVAQAYFDVLGAADTLELVRAQKAAISEQLEQAKRNFEVGTATITDTHEAQARYDLSASQEIAALNDLETKRRQLQLITGKQYPELKTLRPDIKLPPPNPDNMASWVELAEKQNYQVQIAETTAEVAQLEARRNSAAHWPTLDFVASHAQSAQNSTNDSSIGRDTQITVIGLQLQMPLYQGGGLNSRSREAAALSLKAKEELDNTRRGAVLLAQQTYVSVLNGITQIAALEQALVSSQSALESNKLGYEVGVRINIDVLNAQQQVFATRRDLALARYNTIVNHLRLKAVAGALRDEDVEAVNRGLGS